MTAAITSADVALYCSHIEAGGTQYTCLQQRATSRGRYGELSLKRHEAVDQR